MKTLLSRVATTFRHPYGALIKLVSAACLIFVLAALVGLWFPVSHTILLLLGICFILMLILLLLILHSRLRGKLDDVQFALALEGGLRRWNASPEAFFYDGAAATPSLQLLNLKILELCRPKAILELGSGQTTKLLSCYASKHSDVQVLSLEQNRDWWETLRPHVHHEYCLAELKDSSFALPTSNSATIRTKWYDVPETFKDSQFSYVLVDGPDPGTIGTAHVPFARSGFLQYVPQILARPFVVVFDDAERSGESMTIDAFDNLLRASKLQFIRFRICGVKSQEVFCSPEFSFLRSV